MSALVWFRSDLRLTDNTALVEASEEEAVTGVYFVTPEQWAEHDWGAPKVEFVLSQVQALASDLGQKGLRLIVRTVDRFEDIPAELVRVAKEVEAKRVYWNREYEVNERRRDTQAEAALLKANVVVYSFDDQVLLAPDDPDLRTTTGGPYTVFTPFKKRFYSILKERGIPEVAKAPRKSGDEVKPPQVETQLDRFGESGVSQDLWPAGEKEAKRRLKRFIERGLENYDHDRDFPALDGTSTLSPYLSCGVISPRQCLAAALEANDGKLDTGNQGAQIWISEIIWREFYRHVLFHYPRVCRYRAFRPEYESVPWRESDDDFERWSEGRTGIPIVDAGMRQLNQTGWMHNRLRMIVAMFLTKQLLIDWRRGERYFMQHLVDGDLASNNGGWQWSASTGTDAAPYFRIFNPVSQSKKFDPEGEFIRKYCPELESLGGKEIHDPFASESLFREEIDYPRPMVDLKEARERALAAFKERT